MAQGFVIYSLSKRLIRAPALAFPLVKASKEGDNGAPSAWTALAPGAASRRGRAAWKTRASQEERPAQNQINCEVIMNYYFSKSFDGSFDEAIAKVTEALKGEGFGILTEIDVKETLKKKIGVDFYKYRILGACNPTFAYQALQAEDKIGLMLPCNVIVQEKEAGNVEVSAIDPVASMQAVENSALGNVANEVREKLRQVIEGL